MADTKNDEAIADRAPSAVDIVPTADTDEKGARLSDNEIIANRSADIDKAKASKNEHVKVFVIEPGPKPTEENGYDHAANKAATIQYAISQGMRPKKRGPEAVRLVSIEQHPNGISWNLTYAVEVDVAENIEHAAKDRDTVTAGEDVPANTEGNGHSGDTRRKAGQR